jgi:hypothetical protein
MSYDYDKNDGKIHTRWSDLRRCSTTKGALTVAAEMVLNKRRWTGDDFGSLRHKMWEKEAKETGLFPEDFREILPAYKVSLIEQKFAMELLPEVILHSTIDVYAHEEFMLIDYKTFTNEDDLQKYKQPAKKAQLLTYGLQLLGRGHKVKRVMFAGERWKVDRERLDDADYQPELLGYDHVIMPVSMIDMLKQRDVLKENATRLLAAIRVLQQEPGATVLIS